MGEGRSFTSLGIREIAREAGMVPNAFYRHFRNTDELGLELVEEMGIALRRLLREARQTGTSDTDIVRRSVQVYRHYVVDNRLLFLFVSSERSGGSRILRMAIRNEVTHFTNEMRRISVAWVPTRTCPRPACKWSAASSSPPCWQPHPKFWTFRPTSPCWSRR